jgi:hypothetical protein
VTRAYRAVSGYLPPARVYLFVAKLPVWRIGDRCMALALTRAACIICSSLFGVWRGIVSAATVIDAGWARRHRRRAAPLLLNRALAL